MENPHDKICLQIHVSQTLNNKINMQLTAVSERLYYFDYSERWNIYSTPRHLCPQSLALTEYEFTVKSVLLFIAFKAPGLSWYAMKANNPFKPARPTFSRMRTEERRWKSDRLISRKSCCWAQSMLLTLWCGSRATPCETYSCWIRSLQTFWKKKREP